MTAPSSPRLRRAPGRPGATVRRLAVVEEPRGLVLTARRARLLVAAAVAFAGMAVFGLVTVHVLLTEGQFRLEHLQQQADDQQAQYLRLRLQTAQLESPVRVVAAAQQLGMTAPASVTYLTPSAPVVPSGAAPAGSSANGSSVGGSSAPAPDSTKGWAAAKPALAGRR